MGEVQRMPEPGKPAATSDSMVSMLERVLMDPSVPVERLERLLELQDRERTRQAKEAFSRALAAAQKDMRAVLVDKDNTQTQSKYASYAALDAKVRPIYTEAGFSVTFNAESVGERTDVIRVVALVENFGYERRYEIEMPADGKGARGGDVMTRTHAVKSAVTYGRSTLLPMIFNLAVTDRADDDGNRAGTEPRPAITAAQAEHLRDEMRERGVDEEKFCDFVGVETVEMLAADLFDQALAKVRMKRKPGEASDGA